MGTATEPRVVIVTGGSRGIGRAVIERLAADRYSIVIGYGNDANSANEATSAVEAAGARAIAVRADVSNAGEVAALFEHAEQTFGHIDVVVHAAAEMKLAPLVDFDLDVLERMLKINVLGTFIVDQQAARRLRPGGAIVNFSSSVIGRVLPGYTGYAGTKGAVEAMTFILAHELRGREVTVNAIAPGPTATDMFLDGKTQEQLELFAKGSPLERLGAPADIAEVVAFIASPEGHWVNAQTIRVNGGLN